MQTIRGICLVVGLAASAVVILGPPSYTGIGLLIAAPTLATAVLGHHPGRRHE